MCLEMDCGQYLLYDWYRYCCRRELHSVREAHSVVLRNALTQLHRHAGCECCRGSGADSGTSDDLVHE